MIDWFILAPAAFFAGMVDAVVGGGGLIQIPVLLGQFPQTAIPTLFGTNKVSSIAGTGAALWRYARVRIPWLVVLPARPPPWSAPGRRGGGRLAAARSHAPAGRRADDRRGHLHLHAQGSRPAGDACPDRRDRWRAPPSVA
jgi:hypothetical protein